MISIASRLASTVGSVIVDAFENGDWVEVDEGRSQANLSSLRGPYANLGTNPDGAIRLAGNSCLRLPTHINHDHPNPVAPRACQLPFQPLTQLPWRLRAMATGRNRHVRPTEPEHEVDTVAA